MCNLFAFVLFAVTAFASPLDSSPAPVVSALATIDVHAPKATLHLEVADTDTTRERGLMDRTALPPHHGMLFVFDQDGPVDFWMKDTLLPLDMVFVGTDGTVRTVAAKVPVVPLDTPDDNIPHRRGEARYVIELAAGEAARDGIVPGIHLPGAPTWDHPEH